MFRIIRFLRLPTTKDVFVNTVGSYVNVAFATFYTIFLARVFDRVEFGVLSVLLVFSYVLANILSFGMPASIYAHLPDIAKDGERAMEFLKSNVFLLMGLAGTALFVIFGVSGYIDKNFFKLDAPSVYYALALTGTFLYVLQNFVRDSLNAIGEFLHINIAVNISNFVKASILIILAMQSRITIGNTLAVLGIVGPLVVFAVVLFERRWIVSSLVQTRISKKAIKIGYTVQYFIATQLFMIATRVDLFLVAFFLLPGDKGDYGLSQRIALAIVTTTDSITQVLSPQFAKAHTPSKILKLFRKGFMYMILPSAIFVAASFTPTGIYDLFFTTKFTQSVPITKLLSIAYIPFNFAAVMILFFLYSIRKPKYVLVANFILVVILLVGNVLFIPSLGLFGPPIAAVAAFTTVLVFLTGSFVREFRRLKR